MPTLTEYEAKALAFYITGKHFPMARAYVELTDMEDMLDLTIYFREAEDSPKQRIDATFKLHKSAVALATEAVDESIYDE